MCTIITLDLGFWTANRNAVLARMRLDARMNADGFALVCLDSMFPELNMRLSTMTLEPIITLVETFFSECSDQGRIFLHSRMATTEYVGIGFNHGFDDRNGRLIMHNGILRSGRKFTVDSFALAHYPTDSIVDTYDKLMEYKEVYANIFVIDTVNYNYGVIRLSTGTLYTDGKGNYSTNIVGSMKSPVRREWLDEHFMELPEPTKITKDEFSSWEKYWDEKYAAWDEEDKKEVNGK